jgi:hypothetical protein
VTDAQLTDAHTSIISAQLWLSNAQEALGKLTSLPLTLGDAITLRRCKEQLREVVLDLATIEPGDLYD